MGLFDRFRSMFTDEPAALMLRGYKRAYLVVSSDDEGLGPVIETLSFVSQVGVPYAADVAAVCSLGPDPHGPDEVPAPDCKCGYHALRNRDEIAQFLYAGGELPYRTRSLVEPTSALLEVALWGRVIEGSTGYRASHQKIFSVSFPALCASCPSPATAVGWSPPPRRWPSAAAPLYSICGSCAADGPTTHTFTLAEIASQLGVEVFFDPAVAPSVDRAVVPRRKKVAGLAHLAAAALAMPAASMGVELALAPYPSGLPAILLHAFGTPLGMLIAMLVVFCAVLARTPDRVLAALPRVAARFHRITAVALLLGVLTALVSTTGNDQIRDTLASPAVASAPADVHSLAAAVAANPPAWSELTARAVAYAANWKGGEVPAVVDSDGNTRQILTSLIADDDGVPLEERPAVYYDDAIEALLVAELEDGACVVTAYPLPTSAATPVRQVTEAAGTCSPYPYAR